MWPSRFDPGSAAEFIQVEVAATRDKYPVWKQSVRVTFRRDRAAWKTLEWPMAILALLVVPALILEDRTTNLRSLGLQRH